MLSLRIFGLVMFKVQPHLTFHHCHPWSFIAYLITEGRGKKPKARGGASWERAKKDCNM